ncbi:hypothetical protein A8709_04610 [Paenibacillus pectinilyticus]|uniref:Uncharacterized protein n=1 Tax=Paenibacillus pectinilyticus TaxID=512399 RepID=A0A1C0ZSC6_9BACL|nr:XkdW family protein [Paenibacillus pectinilyticus]OCT10989.1 hypothetical protein A8709_04610 [Paenibacillus pectinilyticus]
MNIVQAIIHLYPQAVSSVDFIVQDDSDGNGPYIAQWNLEHPQPTTEELQSAWDTMQPTPEQVLNDVRSSHINKLNAACNTSILEGFTSSALGTDNTYDFEYHDQINLEGMLNAISAGIITENIIWKASGVPQPHNFEQFKVLYADGLAHKNANINKYWELKAEAISANNAEDIVSIMW